MKIVSKEGLPATTNGWGFGGSTDKVRYQMENGDVWISGKAHYRHLPSEKYIQARFYDESRPEWTEFFRGSAVNDHDVILKGSPEKAIDKFYTNIKNKKS